MYELLDLLQYICHFMVTSLFVYLLFIYLHFKYLFIYLSIYLILFTPRCFINFVHHYWAFLFAFYVQAHMEIWIIYTYKIFFFFIFCIFMFNRQKRQHFGILMLLMSRDISNMKHDFKCALLGFFCLLSLPLCSVILSNTQNRRLAIAIFCNTFRYWPLQFIFMARAWCSAIFFFVFCIDFLSSYPLPSNSPVFALRYTSQMWF